MIDMFAEIFLGHLARDYILQNRAMMLNKTEKGRKGLFWCTLHCLFYTLTLCLFLGTANPLAAGIIFASHWPIDRWSLADKWMEMIRGRRPGITYKNKEIDAAFYAIVYAACDNAMHLILMWTAIKHIL